MTDLPVTYRGSVYPWHCDQVGHMNVMHYVGKFDEATWNLFTALGLTPTYFRDSGRGMAALEQTVRYKRELLAGDVVVVRSRLNEMEGKKIRFTHWMLNGETGDLAAECELFAVHVDTEQRKTCPFPDDIQRHGRETAAAHALAAAPKD